MIRILQLLLLSALGLIALASCQHSSRTGEAATEVVYVGADPRIELMSVVQMLSGYFLVTKHDIAYKAAVQQHFEPYGQHRAVQLFKEMSKAGFAFSTVPDAMLRFTPPPELRPRTSFSSEVLEGAGGEPKLEEFAAALRDFAAVSRFKEFFEQNGAFYSQLADGARPSVVPVITSLSSYTGIPIRNSKVVLGPLLHDGGFAAFYELPGGKTEAYAFIGPVGSNGGVPNFGTAERISDLAAHEFAHLVVNPLTELNASSVNSHSSQFPALAAAMKKNGYERWDQAVNEHVIRAITTRLIYRERGPEAGAKTLAEEIKRGFVYVPALMAKLQYYEQNRPRYATIGDFYPELLEAFATAPSA